MVACSPHNGKVWLLVAAIAAASNARPAGGQIPCGYEVSAIIQGPFCGIFGYPPTIPSSIAEDGTVVGFYYACTAGPMVPFRWTEQLGFNTLSLPYGFSEGAAWDIDDQTGWMVGGMTARGENRPTAAVWTAPNFAPIDLGTLPGGNLSEAIAISDGRVVGRWGNNIMGNPALQAFLWEDGVMMDLGPDLGTDNGEARDINEAGQVVGWMGTVIFQDARAFIWQDGQVMDLGPIPGGFTSAAQAINSKSDVVGSGLWIDPDTSDEYTRAFFWRDSQMTNLGTLPGFMLSGVFDVNDAGVVVGRVWGGSGNSAIVWHDGMMLDLNTLIPPDEGVHVDIAYGVNNAGEIVCRGTDQNGDVVGIVLNPIAPPPGDLTCDGTVSVSDLLALLAAWGPCPLGDDCPADLDGDGEVGVGDLLIQLGNWG